MAFACSESVVGVMRQVKGRSMANAMGSGGRYECLHLSGFAGASSPTASPGGRRAECASQRRTMNLKQGLGPGSPVAGRRISDSKATFKESAHGRAGSPRQIRRGLPPGASACGREASPKSIRRDLTQNPDPERSLAGEQVRATWTRWSRLLAADRAQVLASGPYAPKIATCLPQTSLRRAEALGLQRLADGSCRR